MYCSVILNNEQGFFLIVFLYIARLPAILYAVLAHSTVHIVANAQNNISTILSSICYKSIGIVGSPVHR